MARNDSSYGATMLEDLKRLRTLREMQQRALREEHQASIDADAVRREIRGLMDATGTSAEDWLVFLSDREYQELRRVVQGGD